MLNLIRVHELMLPNLALRAFGGPVLTRSERRMPLLLSVLPTLCIRNKFHAQPASNLAYAVPRPVCGFHALPRHRRFTANSGLTLRAGRHSRTPTGAPDWCSPCYWRCVTSKIRPPSCCHHSLAMPHRRAWHPCSSRCDRAGPRRRESRRQPRRRWHRPRPGWCT